MHKSDGTRSALAMVLDIILSHGEESQVETRAGRLSDHSNGLCFFDGAKQKEKNEKN